MDVPCWLSCHRSIWTCCPLHRQQQLRRLSTDTCTEAGPHILWFFSVVRVWVQPSNWGISQEISLGVTTDLTLSCTPAMAGSVMVHHLHQLMHILVDKAPWSAPLPALALMLTMGAVTQQGSAHSSPTKPVPSHRFCICWGNCSSAWVAVLKLIFSGNLLEYFPEITSSVINKNWWLFVKKEKNIFRTNYMYCRLDMFSLILNKTIWKAESHRENETVFHLQVISQVAARSRLGQNNTYQETGLSSLEPVASPIFT